jgi:choline-glycine betaine transporter
MFLFSRPYSIHFVFQLFSKHSEKVPPSWAHIGWVELTSTVLLLLGGDIGECSRVLKGDKSYCD